MKKEKIIKEIEDLLPEITSGGEKQEARTYTIILEALLYLIKERK